MVKKKTASKKTTGSSTAAPAPATPPKTVTAPVVPVVPAKPVKPSPKIWTGLELTPWLVAAGAAADTGAAGNVPVASQGTVSEGTAYVEIDPRGKPYANSYFYKQLGANNALDTYDYLLRMMIATADECAAAQAIELDIQQCIGGVVYNTGLQFDFQANQIRVWSRHAKETGDPNPWKPTGQPCPRWLPEVWFNIDLKTHRTATAVVYDMIDLQPSTLTFPAPKLGLPDMMNVAVQLDGNSAGAPFRVYLDEVNFTLS